MSNIIECINKIIFGDKVLIDLTEDTVTEETLAAGVTAHNAAGEQIVGTMESSNPNTEFVTEDDESIPVGPVYFGSPDDDLEAAEETTFGYVKDSSTEEWVPVERDEEYSILSSNLNDIAKKVGEMAGTTKLLTVSEILDHLNNTVLYIPQGRASSEFTLGDFTSSASGVLSEVQKSTATSQFILGNFESSAVGVLVEN